MAGGTAVTITGTNFAATDATTCVHFGATLGHRRRRDVHDDDHGRLAGRAPPGRSTSRVSDAAGTSNAASRSPTSRRRSSRRTGSTPTAARRRAAQTVTITGTNFPTGTTNVSFGGAAPATNVVVRSDGNHLTAVTPAGNPGDVNVIVTTSAESRTRDYLYVGAAHRRRQRAEPGLRPRHRRHGGHHHRHRPDRHHRGDLHASRPTSRPAVPEPSRRARASPPSATPGQGDDPGLRRRAGRRVCITARAAPPRRPSTSPSRGPRSSTPTASARTRAHRGWHAGDHHRQQLPQGDPNVTVSFGGHNATQVNVESSTRSWRSRRPARCRAPVPARCRWSSPTRAGRRATARRSPSPTSWRRPSRASARPAVSPSGGETVIIKGTNLCNATSVLFGSDSAPITNITPDCTTIR